MNECPHHLEAQSYFDGELNDAAHSSFEQHMPECVSCTQELSRLEALSGIVATSRNDGTGYFSRRLSQISDARLMRRIDQAIAQSAQLAAERGFIRLAGALSGIAASIVIFGSVLLTTASALDEMQTAQPAVSWVEVSGSEVQLTAENITPAADWYLASDAQRNDGMGEK